MFRVRHGARRAAGWLATTLACLLLLVALTIPEQTRQLTPAGFLRLPLEGLVGVALILALPERPRRRFALGFGGLLGLLLVLRAVDLGFRGVLARPFNPVLDWPLFGNTFDFVAGSVGRSGAVLTVVAAVLAAVALPVATAVAARRVTRLVAGHHTTATRVTALLTAVWAGCALVDARIGPHVPLAADSASTLAAAGLRSVQTGLADRAAFAAEARSDPFATTPDDALLTALRGKDVVVAFVESYGRSAVEDPPFAPQVDAVLDAGTASLAAKGFAARSAFLTSPTAGGGSWLAHATLLSGLWIDNQRRYHDLMASDRLTLSRAFAATGHRTVAFMPGTSKAWPEREFYDYQQAYDYRNLGYRGRPFSWISSMPDQYTLAAFERTERRGPAGAAGGRAPVMAEIDLTSSHEPWAPIPRLIDWGAVGDGTVFDPMTAEGDPPDVVWRSQSRIRTEYRRSIEYTLSTLVSYVQTYGDDNLVLLLLGDHQPAPVVTGEHASRDVPVTVVTRDQAVLDRIAGWGWQDGLRPGPAAPVWRMDAFRNRFLAAFS